MRNVKRKLTGLLVILIVLAAVIVFGLFRVQKVVVVGNENFTAKQIQQAVMQDGLCKNSLYLLWKFGDADRAESALPFLSAIEVTLVNPFKVQLRVYEKQEVGYIQTGGKYVYFDKEGLIVESSDTVHEGVPEVTGVSATDAALYDTLELSDETQLASLLTLAGGLAQEQLKPDEIRFSTTNQIILIFGKVKALLGTGENLTEKIAALSSIYPQVEGQEGNLHMQNYSLTAQTVTFRQGESDEELGIALSDGGETDSSGTETAGSADESLLDGDSPVKETEELQTEAETEAGVQTGTNGTFQTDSSGTTYYTDEGGHTTYDCDSYIYANEDGSIISDGYGYCDPYTGYYYTY